MSRRLFAVLGLIPLGLVRSPDLQWPAGTASDAGTPAQAARLVPAVFEGIVFDAHGAPLRGASVTSSAGGHAITDRGGKYRLAVDVPVQAQSVEITVVGGLNSELVARRSASFTAGSAAVTWLEPIELSPEGAGQPNWLPAFGGDPGESGHVHDLEEFDDGSGPALYAAGSFHQILGVASSGLARWDGTRWSEIGTQLGASDRVDALAVFDDGSGPALYAGGTFHSIGGVVAENVAKWDGASWTALGTGVNETTVGPIVRDLAVFDDGSGPALYAGGRFTTAGGMPVGHLAKWDGSSWSAVSVGVTAVGTETPVHALEVFDDGAGEALYVAGRFVADGTIQQIAKLDGSSWSPLGSGIQGGSQPTVHELTVFDDGGGPALYAGGTFSMAGGVSASGFARWDGASWSAVAGSPAVGVRALGSFDDGSGPALYVGGFFEAGGELEARLWRWDGSSWELVGAASQVDDSIDALAWFDDGSGPALYVGGDFTGVGGAKAHKVARWDGSGWSSVGKHGITPWVHALVAFEDDGAPALYAAGPFQFSDIPFDEQVARWDGSSWTSVGGTNQGVEALAAFDDGSGLELYAAGSFGILGGEVANRIARWDGASWNALGSGLNGTAFALAAFDDGSGPALYAGGSFSTAGGGAALRVARWDGSSWSNLGAGLGPSGRSVRAFAVLDDGSGPKLYAGGSFTTAGGQAANRIARWDGTSWSALGSGMDDTVLALAVFDDGDGAALYAAGEFLTAGGVAAEHVAKWNGTSWEPLGLGLTSGSVSRMAMTVFDDGSGPALYVGGVFTLAGGVPTSGIARWDGSDWSALGAGMSSPQVFALAVYNDRQGAALHAGGSFTQAPSGDSHLAKWGRPDTTPPVLVCPEPVVVDDLFGPAGEVVTFEAVVEDAEDYQPNVEFSPPSGSHFPRGTTLVTCTVTDAAGNQAVCQFPVTVVHTRFREVGPPLPR